MFFSIWACDSAAFFFGSKFGKKKILPLVSPKKSWVGSISGFVATMLVVYAFYFYNAFGDYLLSYHLVVLGIIYGAISQFGDFGESLLKREVKIKDSSTLLKGHGGVLDRFDSMLIAAPLTYLYLVYFV
jgi:phosphatidate cytidylyltransferase